MIHSSIPGVAVSFEGSHQSVDVSSAQILVSFLVSVAESLVSFGEHYPSALGSLRSDVACVVYVDLVVASDPPESFSCPSPPTAVLEDYEIDYGSVQQEFGCHRRPL